MIIHPDIFTTPDLPTIRFKEPRDQVDLDIELPKILHSQGWGCGTYFHIQFLSHDKTELLASAKYVVTQENENMHTSDENPYQPVTKMVFNRKAERIGEWDLFGLAALEGESVKTVDDGMPKISWNPGKQLHQAKIGDEVVYENNDENLVLEYIKGKKVA